MAFPRDSARSTTQQVEELKSTSFPKWVLAVSALAAATSASANFVTNGDFEQTANPDIPGNINAADTLNKVLGGTSSDGWDVYDAIPGWTKVATTRGIEVQHALVGPADNNYVELDAHPSVGNSAMYQMLALPAGVYSLSFDYYPRTTVQGDNTITAYWLQSGLPTTANLGTVIAIADGPPPSGWNTYGGNFSATGPGYLVFAASGSADTLGGFIDNVSVPDGGSTLMLAGLGMVVFGALRRKLA